MEMVLVNLRQHLLTHLSGAAPIWRTTMRMPRHSQRYCCDLSLFRLLLGATRLPRYVPQVLIPALCVLVSIISASPPTYAQSATATLSGTVDDQNGAIIA